MSNLSLAQRIGLLASHLRNLGSIVWRAEARFRGAHVGTGVVFAGRPILSVAKGSQMRIGDHVQFNSGARTNPVGCFQPCVLRTLSPEARLEIGAHTGFSAAVVVAGKEIQIGEGTLLGAGSVVIDNDFHFPMEGFRWGFDGAANARPVVIGRGCFIGARALILKGVTIGDRAIVGAGAVVTKDVPAGSTAAGNPAKIISRAVVH